MNNRCKLSGVKSKRMIKSLLHLSDNQLFSQRYVASLIRPYIDLSKGKPRLIEAPDTELKIVQKRIKNLLSEIDVPDNIFSGVKGKSYTQNANWHLGNRYLYKVDLTAFFPSTSREKVYTFFHRNLETSPDIAEILTNISTVKIELSNVLNIEPILKYLEERNVKTTNHLISGSPASQILSYLVNQDMFNELQKFSWKNNVIMTVYVDDISFSSTCYISRNFKNQVTQIIKKYGYRISTTKVKSYSKLHPKLITGVVITKSGHATVKNSLRRKIIEEFEILKSNPNENDTRLRLRGYVNAARQIDAKIYPSIRRFAFDKDRQ